MIGIAKDQSLNPTNKTSRRLLTGTRNAGPSATTICNAYAKAKKEDPSLEYRCTFSEWKKTYMREHNKKRRARKKANK